MQYRGVLSQLESRSSVTSACDKYEPNRRSRSRRRFCGSKPSLPDFQDGKRVNSERIPHDFPVPIRHINVLSVQDTMPAVFVDLKPRVASKPYAQMAPFPMLLSPGI